MVTSQLSIKVQEFYKSGFGKLKEYYQTEIAQLKHEFEIINDPNRIDENTVIHYVPPEDGETTITNRTLTADEVKVKQDEINAKINK